MSILSKTYSLLSTGIKETNDFICGLTAQSILMCTWCGMTSLVGFATIRVALPPNQSTRILKLYGAWFLLTRTLWLKTPYGRFLRPSFPRRIQQVLLTGLTRNANKWHRGPEGVDKPILVHSGTDTQRSLPTDQIIYLNEPHGVSSFSGLHVSCFVCLSL